jgi:hypothetical protein
MLQVTQAMLSRDWITVSHDWEGMWKEAAVA